MRSVLYDENGDISQESELEMGGGAQNSVALEENGQDDLIFSLISFLWFSNNVSIMRKKSE